jgi:chromosome segregation ATPase
MVMTRITRSAAVLMVIVAIGAASAWRPAVAQSQRNDDILPALLTEVRGLRAAMEQMASGSTQAQLLVGRLQLQEGRVTSMIRRLDTVRDSLATARREYDQVQGALKMLGKEAGPPGAPQDDKENLLAGLSSQVAATKANVDRLSAEEMELTADIATEQQRWVAINQRLDDLERTLAKR